MSDTSQPLRVGVIGLGSIAQMMHLPHLAERPDRFQIVAAADVNPHTLEQVGARYQIPSLTSDFQEVCRRDDVQAVVVASSGSHKAAVLAALEAGKHVLVEKPLGYGTRETEEVSRAAEKSGLCVMVGYHKRFDPAYRRAAELVRAMEDLRYVEVTVLHPDDGGYRVPHTIWPDPDRASEPYSEAGDRQRAIAAMKAEPLAPLIDDVIGADSSDDQRVAAKILCESLIHDVNLVRGVLGEPEEVLSAHLWRGGFAQTSVTRFAGGVHANMSWLMLPGLRNYEETVRFIGARQRITLTFPSPYLRHFPTPLTVERMDGGDLVVEHRTQSYEEAFRAELEHFRGCVLSGTPPELGWKDAVGDARWIRELATALRRG